MEGSHRRRQSLLAAAALAGYIIYWVATARGHIAFDQTRLRLEWPGPVEAGIYVAVPALLLGLLVRRPWAVLAAGTVILAAAAFVPARTVTEHDFDVVTVSTIGLALDRTTLLASLGAVGFAGLGVILGRPLTLLRRVTAPPLL